MDFAPYPRNADRWKRRGLVCFVVVLGACTGYFSGGPAGALGPGSPLPGVDGGAPIAVAPSANLIPQADLFTCTPGTASDAPNRIRRVNRWQWTRNVGGTVNRTWTGFSFYDNPLDPDPNEQFGSYATGQTVDDSMVEIILPIVQQYGTSWTGPYSGDPNRLELWSDTSLQCILAPPRPSASCVQYYLTSLLERGVLYRPPRVDELARLTDFANSVLSQEDTDGGQAARSHSLVRIVTAAMMTSGALFRDELGVPTGNGRVQLGDWELGQQLAYALGDRAPGAVPTYAYPYYSAPSTGHYADIVDAARDGGIRSPDVVKALIQNNIGGTDPTRFDLVADFDSRYTVNRGEEWLSNGVANFFRQWLGYPKVEQVFKDRPEATSAFDTGSTDIYRGQLGSYNNLIDRYYGYESTFVQQMDDFVARVVVPDQDVLKNLLTSRWYFLAATTNGGSSSQAIAYTNQPYGISQDIQQTNASRWQLMPAAERSGMLTHPAWLSAHGGNIEDDPSIVHRGKWVRENLLCGFVPPLSDVRVAGMLGPHSPDKNGRARITEATARPECQTCHALMNPLGYPFETYNHAGYLRVHDHAPDAGWMPPDGTSTLTGMPDPALDGPVRDAVELSGKLANSPYVKRCFLRQVFRYFMGRDENRTDACTLSSMEAAYDGNSGSLRAAMQALMTSDTWTTRRQPAAGE